MNLWKCDNLTVHAYEFSEGSDSCLYIDLLGNSPADKVTKGKKAKLEAQLEEVAKRSRR